MSPSPTQHRLRKFHADSSTTFITVVLLIGRHTDRQYVPHDPLAVVVLVVVVDDGTHARTDTVNERAPCQREDLLRRCSKDV